MLTAPITAAPDVETFFRTGPASHSEEDTITLTDSGLDALLHAPTVPDAEENEEESEAFTPDAFVPDTADKADWVLMKIADARARAARVRENAEKIARQHEAEAEGLEWRFGAALQAFCRRETEGTRRKSLRLLNGVLGYRTRPAGVSLTDPAAALAWAKSNLPAAVVETLNKKALAETLLETGEVPDGVTLVPAEEVFYIR